MDASTLERWAAKVLVDSSGCLLWTASRTRDGYGRLKVDGLMKLAHRLSYEHFVAPIQPGLQLDHLCRVRHCVNAAHLEPVSPAVNTYRGSGPCGINARKTHCVRGHELFGDNLRLVLSGGALVRRCLACYRDTQARRTPRRSTTSGAS